ncbi:cytochrome P450 6B7-like [Choristoneura fumiferana]|uniref:cytochrome P450 6B7-like n=1 Tax=Choristoneura fumiferana TaxID=7141 RepID=UPI003D15BAF7
MLVILGTLLSLVAAATYFVLTHKYNFWKKYGLPSPKPLPLLGNYADFILMRKNLGDTFTEICKQFPNEPIIGTYYGTEPAVIIKDPELLKLVITKDFYYFSSRELREHVHREPATKNVFSAEGDYWRVMRQNLTPVFSSAKMKKMFYLIEKRTEEYQKVLAKEINEKQIHDARSFNTRFTMDCIGSCIFGVDTNAMSSAANENPFRIISDKILDFSPKKLSKVILRSIWPSLFYALKMQAFPKEANDFFANLVKDVFKERNHKPSARNDFVDFILSFKQNDYLEGDEIKSMKIKDGSTGKIKLSVDDEMLVAQCLVFFAAGFETSAATMSFTLYELAKKPEVLQKVLEEVDEHMKTHDGKITYDCVTELPYLEACIDESLRLYPVLGGLTREVVEDYTLPSGVVLKKGVRVHIPVYYLQKHPDYFPEPEEYRPERFLGANKQDVKPFTYYPFGEGPRICIGMRFAKMQMLAGLVTLLKDYTVELPATTPRKLTFTPNAFTTQTREQLALKFLPRRVLAA